MMWNWQPGSPPRPFWAVCCALLLAGAIAILGEPSTGYSPFTATRNARSDFQAPSPGLRKPARSASPRVVFRGLYLPEEDTPKQSISPTMRTTERFVPLGVPMERTLAAEKANRVENERKATAAFKVRVGMPGALGPELTAKVQSLRVLLDERYLGQEDVGAAVAPPGGPGWPDNEVVVTLRRLGTGADEDEVDPSLLDSETGPFSTAFNLYESIETVLLVADPRARRAYHLQDSPDTESADEKAQCRRCDWPYYLPDPKDVNEENDPALADVKELLAGRYLRVFLDVDPEGAAETRQRTEDAIAFFEGQGENYRPPLGWARVAAPADAVPSPLQASLAEPPQNPATWTSSEAGTSVALVGGEVLLHASDHTVRGRGLPFTVDRAYRSAMLGYSPFGSAGWSGNVFAHLREIETTGEVEYHDGNGHVWRFLPRGDEEAPEGWEDDVSGSYQAPEGVYLRLLKLRGDSGWRLLGRQHDSLFFDAEGRLVEVADRHRRNGTAGEQGNTISYRYDPFGQLTFVEDDLGRGYRFEYYDDPRPESQGGDGERYGLLKKVTDFLDREIEYEFDTDRTLRKVRLPDVRNSNATYSEFSYEGENRPTIEYRYDPSTGVSSVEKSTTAVLHGKYAKLRLESYLLPDFVELASGVPRVRFEYDTKTGRVAKVAYPTRDNQNTPADSIDWTFDYSMLAADAAPASRMNVRAPWGHEVDYRMSDGRAEELREELEIYPPVGDPFFQTVTTKYAYADDGRLVSVTMPDGSHRLNCYPDAAGTAPGDGCPNGEEGVDRLAKANVIASIHRSTRPGGQGTADYTSIETGMSYQEDNYPDGFIDGLERSVSTAVPRVDGDSSTSFDTEGLSGDYNFDNFGRLASYTGGGASGPLSRQEYGEDARGRGNSGLLRRVEQGKEGQARLWRELDYDDAWNVEERRDSNGVVTRTSYDEWDRVTRTVSGLSDGRFRPLGIETCDDGKGAAFEVAYDSAGHKIRERRLQDYVDENGDLRCRWVETRYQYNVREQIVAMEQTHVASPDEPGAVINAPRRVAERKYDEFGRLDQEIALNLREDDLVTDYRYDDASRLAGTKVGDAAEQVTGFDENSRAVFQSDGDEGIWRGRYDVWDRVYHEELPTGAVVRSHYDKANNPTRATVWNGDPLLSATAEILSDVRTHYTSFGEVERLVEVLTNETEDELRVTEQVFDESGRLQMILSGPPLAGKEELDRSLARREMEYEYEPATSRVLKELYGGSADGPELFATRYEYLTDNMTPWPDRMIALESVPGEVELVETSVTEVIRDALGRPVLVTDNNGQKTETIYDRVGAAIQVRTGAGTTSSVGFDGRGLPVRHIRPNNRGVTTYAYDYDGRLRRKETTTASGSGWERVYGYDRTGRITRIDHEDETFETWTYNVDNTIETQRTREGLTLSLGYDAANRLRRVVPSGVVADTLVALDAGNFYDYDELSRPTEARRGSAGGSEPEPALRVGFSGYDIASRPSGEVVGGRAALSWKYDTWDRPVELTLPEGVGRNGGPFTGYNRQYDTLDRLFDIGGHGGELTGTPLGVTWAWGGAARMYGCTTKGPLGTSARYGYIAGRGAQPPASGGSSEWRLGTMTWGSSAGGDPITTAAQPLDDVWGQFGFGWRGTEGDPRDGVKAGRVAVGDTVNGGLDLFAGMGWSWNYDAGVRLSYATSGRGNVEGRAPPEADESFRYEYGKGDELERIIRESEGQIAELTVGTEGRITHRNDIPFSYDEVGRRTEDDRFVYRWNWRGELSSITVKDTWLDEEVTPFAGHQIRYDYDAMGRLTYRWHLAKLPEGETDDSLRPFIEKRTYVWEGQGLLAEVAYGNPEETQVRWRKTYVPGPSGLDDAMQVAVEVVDLPGSGFPGTHLYTYLRDELGTVIGIVAEDEGTDPSQPPLKARYLYTPYGETHVELGPELRRVRFDNDVTSLETSIGTVVQTVENPAAQAAGALRISLSVPVVEGSLASAVKLESLDSGGVWTELTPAVARDTAEGADILVLLTEGWQRGVTYRVQVTSALEDAAGRSLATPEALEWPVPIPTADIAEPPVIFDKRYRIGYESYEASAGTVGGRFPGGQNCLFQGLWTDPVTGISHARARWYDPRNTTWLSEDPYEDIDSPNLYAFVGWQPNMETDPQGEFVTNLAGGVVNVLGGIAGAEICKYFAEDEESSKECDYSISEAAVDFGIGFATSGLSVLGKLKFADELGAGAKWALGEAAEIVVDTAAEVVKAEVSGREYEVKDELIDSTVGALIGEGLSRVGKKAFKGFRRSAGSLSLGDDVADAGRRGSRSLDGADGMPTCRLGACFAEDTEVLTGDGLKPIGEILVGKKVITTNESLSGETAVDETWKVVKLRMPLGDELGDLEMVTLRPPEWVSEMGAVEGQQIWLDLSDPGLSGYATVEAVEPAPEIRPGPGRVVLSTLSLGSGRVVKAWLKGLEKPVETTFDHPVFSRTRNAWVGADDLLAGEAIWVSGGFALVTGVSEEQKRRQVFNLEVEQDHVYLVARLGLLSHNTGAFCGLGDARTSPSLADKRVGVSSHAEEFRSGASYLIPESRFNLYVKGQNLIGDPSGQFVTTSAAMDRLLQDAGTDLSHVKAKLGIPHGEWNERIIRLDIHSPLLHNVRLATGFERGANSLFRWGGYTGGGLPEAIINQVPVGGFSASFTKLLP